MSKSIWNIDPVHSGIAETSNSAIAMLRS